jgi:predicted kinase
MAVGGLSGTGKSSFARAVGPGLGASPGAVVLRTDEIRKRLLDVAPTERVDRDLYTPEFYARTYDTLIGDARALLNAGRAVVLDATFIDPGLRARAERLAAEVGVPFRGVWLDAPVEVLAARVAARTNDASDATVAVLRDQIARLDPSGVDWDRVDTQGDLAEAATAWLARR